MAKDFMCMYRPNLSHSLSRDAEHGDAEAQAALGRLYLKGRPEQSTESSFTPAVEQNPAQATEWLRKAADQGHAEAKRLLESALAKTRGVHEPVLDDGRDQADGVLRSPK